jgi:uncharacterized protein (TIGR03118 family)
MRTWRSSLRGRFCSAAIALAAAALVLLPVPAMASDDGYAQTNLVSDLAGQAKIQDSHLKNPWGISHGPTTPWWVSDNNGNVATLYDGNGMPFPHSPPPGTLPLVVSIPAPGVAAGGTPTGNVFNSIDGDFVVSNDTMKGSSRFIFATEDGTIVGWSPALSLTQAFIAVDNSTVPNAQNGAVYKGLALAQTENGQQLYATNFRAGTVDVFDSHFNPVNRPRAFTDSKLPAGFAPFGIQSIGERIYVTYAMQDAAKHDDVKGPGNGFVDVFTKEGRLLKRLISRGRLNSPWGLTVAPKNFGEFSGDLLVGNFGDGRINAYDKRSGRFQGSLRQPNGTPIEIDGLWGIGFGNGETAGPKNTLFFAAGINDEADGLFGTLTAVGEAENNQ